MRARPRSPGQAQPTAFATGTITTSNIPLSWTAASGTDGYLIQASTTASPGDPTDGTDPTAQTNIAGASPNVKSTGTSYSAFTGYTAGTMYYYKINSYNNSGSCINYKATGSTVNAATLPNAVTSPAISVTGTTGTISWTAASGYNNTNHTTLVFVKASTSVTVCTPPSNPTYYTSFTNIA